MRKIAFTIAIMGRLTANLAFAPVAAIAQTPSKVSFYCGQTFDPSTNKIVPTTIVASSSKREPVALIKWTSKLNGKFTPQVRCNTVSAKIQQAWEAKRLNYLTAGIDKASGLGIICGVKNSSTPCDRSSMLFTLASGADASEVLGRINGIKGGDGSNPTHQNSADNVEIDKIIN